MMLSLGMIKPTCAGRRPGVLGAVSALSSLAWTSLRTPNCCLPSARARRADRFIFRCPPAQGERRRPWRPFPLLCQLEFTPGIGRSVRSAEGADGPAASGDPPLGFPPSPLRKLGALRAGIRHRRTFMGREMGHRAFVLYRVAFGVAGFGTSDRSAVTGAKAAPANGQCARYRIDHGFDHLDALGL